MRLFQVLLFTAIVGFTYSLALADGGTSTAAVGSAPTLLALLALVGCQAIAYGIRRAAPDNHFFHTQLGALAIAGITMVLGAIEPVLQTRGFDKTALAWAGLNGLLSFFTTGNPSVTPDNQSKKPDPPGIVRAMMPLAFGAALGFTIFGCQTPGGKALKDCEMNALPQTLESVLADVILIATNPASVAADLVDLAKKIGPDQVACASQAWAAYIASRQNQDGGTAPSSSRLLAGMSDTQLSHALSVLNSYLAQHPAACRGNYRASVEKMVDTTPYEALLYITDDFARDLRAHIERTRL